MASHSHGGNQFPFASSPFIFFPSQPVLPRDQNIPLNSMLYLSQVLEAQFLSCHLLNLWAALTLGAGIKKPPSFLPPSHHRIIIPARKDELEQSHCLTDREKKKRFLKKKFPTNEGRATPGFRGINPQHYGLFLMDMWHQQANYN